MTDAGAGRREDAPIYVAASWRTPRQQEVVAVLRAAGLPVYDFRNPAPGDNGFGWREIDGGWQNWTAEQFVSALKHPIAQRGFTTDMNALRRAPAVILVQPSGRSAALEFGWGRGAGKPGAVLLAEGQEPELMLGMADLLTTSLDEIVTWAALATRGAHEPPSDAVARGALPSPDGRALYCVKEVGNRFGVFRNDDTVPVHTFTVEDHAQIYANGAREAAIWAARVSVGAPHDLRVAVELLRQWLVSAPDSADRTLGRLIEETDAFVGGVSVGALPGEPDDLPETICCEKCGRECAPVNESDMPVRLCEICDPPRASSVGHDALNRVASEGTAERETTP